LKVCAFLWPWIPFSSATFCLCLGFSGGSNFFHLSTLLFTQGKTNHFPPSSPPCLPILPYLE
jgi:hypothetical protein